MTRAFPPGPRGWSVFGYLRGGNRERLAAWARLRAEYGDLVHAHILGKDYVLVNHPAHVQEILVGQAARVERLELGKSLPKPDASRVVRQQSEHRQLRKLIQPAFQPARLTPYSDTIDAYTATLLSRWADDEVRDITAEMTKLTLRIVARTLFNADVEQSADAFGRAVTLGSAYLAQPGRLPLPTPRNLRLLRAWLEMERTIDHLIAERRRGEAKPDLLSTIIDAVDEEDGFRLDDRQAKGVILSLFIAGHETTAIALNWLLDLLAEHQETQETLYIALKDADSPERVPLLDAIIREAMRLYPPAWVLSRQVVQPLTLDTWTLPPGALLLMSPYIIQRDARFYSEPDRFLPERWLGADERHRFAFFPFGGGPHICTGQFFAWMEIQRVVAVVVRQFRLERVANSAPDLEPLITLRPRGSVHLRLRRR